MANKRFELLEHGIPTWFVGNRVFYSLWDGFVTRDNKEFPERQVLDLGDIQKRSLESLRDIFISPFILAKDIFNQGKHFFKPYENKEQVKKDALLIKTRLIALGKLLLSTLLVGFILALYPLVLLIGIPIFLAKAPATINKKAKAAIVLAAFLFPLLLVMMTALSLIKALMPIILVPLVYILGMPWRGFMSLVRKLFPPAPIEETKSFQNKVATINQLLPAIERNPSSDTDAAPAAPVMHTMAAKDCATLITLTRLLHAQYQHFIVKKRTSLIDSGMEKTLFAAILREYPATLQTQLIGNGFNFIAPTVSVPEEFLVAIRDYAALYTSGSKAKAAIDKHLGLHKFFNLVLRARAFTTARPMQAASRLPIPMQVLEDALVLIPTALGKNPQMEMKRQAFLSRIAEKADAKEYTAAGVSEMMSIEAVDGHKISVPKGVAQIQRHLMLIEDPERALAQARGHKAYGRFFQRVVVTAEPKSTVSIASQRASV